MEKNYQLQVINPEQDLIFLHNASDGIHVLNIEGTLIEVSDSFCNMLGYTRNEMIGMSVAQWDTQLSLADFSAIFLQQHSQQERCLFETQHRCKDGRIIDVEISSMSLSLNGIPVLYSASRDITQRKLVESALKDHTQRLQRTSDFNELMSKVNQQIATVDDEQQFLQVICDLAIRYAHLDLAHVARPDESGRFQSPAASGATGFLDAVMNSHQLASIDATIPEGRGAYSGVWQEETPLFIDSIFSASFASPWYGIFQNFGLNSYAVLPLYCQKQLIGLFAIFHSEENIFNADLQALLIELAFEISCGLDHIAARNLQRALLNNSTVGIILVKNRIIQQSNLHAAQMLGHTPDELINQNSRILYADEQEWCRVEQSYPILCTQPEAQVISVRMQHKDGRILIADISGVMLNKVDRLSVWTITDVTARKQTEEKLLLSASVFTHAREGIIITSATGIILDVNDAFTRITGYNRDEVLGQDINAGQQDKEFYPTMWLDLQEKGYWQGEIWNQRKNDDAFAAMLTISAAHNTQDHTLHYVALLADITEIKEKERQLEYLAYYDSLTSLPNRTLLTDRLQQNMIFAQKHAQRLAVIHIDLDNFKLVNERHGRDIGDQLLIIMSTRMKPILREGDMLARLGGDEFVAILLNLEDIQSTEFLLAQLLALIAQPITIENIVIPISASLGIGCYPQGEFLEADQLLRQADQAMYQAKLTGKNRYHIFDAHHDRNVRGHHESLERIRHALIANEFVMHYQPKVNMRTGAIVGAEALIRWKHPEQGLLPPAAFLPTIENHPLFIDLGEWVIDTALTQIALWHVTGLDIPVSVNIGALQLQQANFVERLRGLLTKHPNIDPCNLELEVLETSMLGDMARASRTIEDCRKMGVSFAMDDFGTGYSSLSYLKHLHVALLKIDQSFVRDMLTTREDLSILDGVISLAAAFNRKVIAEGVETEEHGKLLLQLGCELAQGYGIARPMPALEFSIWATTWQPNPAWADLPVVSRNNLPLLFAGVEHRAWISDIEKILHGQCITPAPQDSRYCHFGIWLASDPPARYNIAPSIFQKIELLHQQVHALALDLLAIHEQGRNPEALARLYELHNLRDALLEQLTLCLVPLEITNEFGV